MSIEPPAILDPRKPPSLLIQQPATEYKHAGDLPNPTMPTPLPESLREPSSGETEVRNIGAESSTTPKALGRIPPAAPEVADGRVGSAQDAPLPMTLETTIQAPPLRASEASRFKGVDSENYGRAEQRSGFEGTVAADRTEQETVDRIPALPALDREVAVRSYLKEVTAWVAATEEMDTTVFDSASEISHDSGTLAQRNNVFRIEPRFDARQVTTPESLVGEHQPQVQDVSLSIGSISIVIEEPRAESATPAVTTQPRAERTQTSGAPEPTRLSRYYLSGW
jgi:hypothetical protein